MEEIGKEGPIQCIFLCEFHPVRGPMIVCQYPGMYITKEIFEAISVYLIPKPQINKCTISINAFGHKITGYPNIINNPKYERNALMFNLCFACGSDSRTVQYEPVVKKLSEYFEKLEQEGGFLSTEDGKRQLPSLLRQVMEDINLTGQCTMEVDIQELRQINRRLSFRSEKKPTDSSSSVDRRASMSIEKLTDSPSRTRTGSDNVSDKNKNETMPSEEESPILVSILHLKSTGIKPDPPIVYDHSVPVLVCPKDEATLAAQHWDLTTQQILPDIDGISHVAKISAKSDVDISLVKSCVQNLSYYGIVILLPCFQYSNVYTTLPGLRKLYIDKDVREECLKSVSKAPNRLPTITNVMQFYSSMSYGVTVRELCIRYNPSSLNIDEFKLVQFGVMHNFIQKIYVYPVAVNPPEEYNKDARLTIHKMCNSLNSMDDICCKFGMTYKDVWDKLEKDQNIVFIRK